MSSSFHSMLGDRTAALLLRDRLTRSRTARLGLRVLCDVRRGGDQFGGDCRRAAGVFVPDHSRGHRRDVRVIARQTARDRLDCRHADQRRGPRASRLPSICRPAPPWSAPSAPRWRWRDCSIRFCAAIARLRCASAFATARWSAAAVLSGSALQLAAAPRADQPLIDLAEYAMPSLRKLYLTRPSRRLRGRRRICGTLSHRSGAIERSGTAQPHAGEALDDFGDAAHFLVPEILRRDAQGRAIRHG